jgi:hypothetical protein
MAVSGCSTFNRDWRAATLAPAPVAPAAGIQGPWEGTWLSESTGHHGRLRCLIEPGGPTGNQARFRANYAGILNFGYTVPLVVEPSPDGHRFHGEANLGVLIGGRYTYDGVITTNRFRSLYHCPVDHGHFDLVRPAAPPSR